mmetsp:Transcript_25122/g.38496  ORF Transcript_25122/g.38496 Transcript_25122/m.38496 type:complete len:83 (+) Transcript_25122:271-519(+)
MLKRLEPFRPKTNFCDRILTRMPIGEHTLETWTKEFAVALKLIESTEDTSYKYSHHSWRATIPTLLYDQNVDFKIYQMVFLV